MNCYYKRSRFGHSWKHAARKVLRMSIFAPGSHSSQRRPSWIMTYLFLVLVSHKIIIDWFIFRRATICFLFILFGQLCPPRGIEGIILGIEQLGLLRISDGCHEFFLKIVLKAQPVFWLWSASREWGENGSPALKLRMSSVFSSKLRKVRETRDKKRPTEQQSDNRVRRIVSLLEEREIKVTSQPFSLWQYSHNHLLVIGFPCTVWAAYTAGQIVLQNTILKRLILKY